MKFIPYFKIVFLILPAVCFARCGSTYSDFFNDPDNTGTAQWATPMKTAPSECKFNAVAVDNDGNTYAVGYVYGDKTFDFGGNSSGVSGKQPERNHAIIVKYDTTGVAQWARAVESINGTSEFNSVGIDDSGNVYVVGFVIGWSGNTFTFGGNIAPFIVPNTYYNTVIAKYNSAGVAQWVTLPASAEQGCQFSGIAVDASGNSYAVGYVGGSTAPWYDFGGKSIGFNSIDKYNNAVIVKYNSSGEAQWATRVETEKDTSQFASVAVDRSGNAYSVGFAFGPNAFNFGGNDSGFTNKYGEENAVIVKYNSSGVAQWATPIESAVGVSFFCGVAVDDTGKAYAVGSVQGMGEYSFGGTSESFNITDSYPKSVIVKYDSSGTAQWATPVRSAPDSCSFNGVTIDVAGNLYAVGVMDNTGLFDFGGNSTSVNGKCSGKNAVIVKYNSSGTAQWARSAVEASTESNFSGIAVDRFGYSYAVGYVGKAGAFNFGGQSLPFNGQPNGLSSVIVKYY